MEFQSGEVHVLWFDRRFQARKYEPEAFDVLVPNTGGASRAEVSFQSFVFEILYHSEIVTHPVTGINLAHNV